MYSSWKKAGLVTIGFVAGWTVASFLWNDIAIRYMNAYQRTYSDLKYWQEGTIERDLVNICEVDGELSVYFKEDCE